MIRISSHVDYVVVSVIIWSRFMNADLSCSCCTAHSSLTILCLSSAYPMLLFNHIMSLIVIVIYLLSLLDHDDLSTPISMLPVPNIAVSKSLIAIPNHTFQVYRLFLLDMYASSIEYKNRLSVSVGCIVLVDQP